MFLRIYVSVIIYKNKSYGLYRSSCELSRYLEKEGIKTLVFTGMNTDQCVMATLQDAHSRGFDTILLRCLCHEQSQLFPEERGVELLHTLGLLVKLQSISHSSRRGT